MKDEIKEILDNISNDIKDYYVGMNGRLYQDLTKEQLLLIKDYITNLQEENKRLNNIIDELEKYLKKENKFDEYKDITYRETMGYVLDKLKELKEGNNE